MVFEYLRLIIFTLYFITIKSNIKTLLENSFNSLLNQNIFLLMVSLLRQYE